jgi:hypothetical protein
MARPDPCRSRLHRDRQCRRPRNGPLRTRRQATPKPRYRLPGGNRQHRSPWPNGPPRPRRTTGQYPQVNGSMRTRHTATPTHCHKRPGGNRQHRSPWPNGPPRPRHTARPDPRRTSLHRDRQHRRVRNGPARIRRLVWREPRQLRRRRNRQRRRPRHNALLGRTRQGTPGAGRRYLRSVSRRHRACLLLCVRGRSRRRVARGRPARS